MFEEDLELGELKPIDDSATVADIGDAIGRHHRALQQLDRSAADYRERLDRAVEDLGKKLGKAQKSARMQWEPGGDAWHQDRRYLLDDESVRWGDTRERVALPDGQIVDVPQRGLLTDHYPVTTEQARMQRAYAGFALAYHLTGRSARAWSHPLTRKAYLAFCQAAKGLTGRVGDHLRRAFSDPELLKRVVSNTSGSGGELVNTPTLSVLRRPYDLDRRIPGLIQTEQVSAPTFTPPIVTGRGLAKVRGATADDPQRYPRSTFTTSSTSVSVIDYVIMALLDPNWLKDASNLLSDPMGLVTSWLLSGVADTLEIAFLHGDTASSHQDTLSTWTLDSLYSAGDLDGSDSMLKKWIGFRARAYDDSATVAGGGAFSASGHFGALNAMGVRAQGNVVAITGLHVLFTQLLTYSNFLTVDKIGQRATLLTGEVGAIGGKPVIISQMVTNDMANTGLYTGSGATSYMVYVDTDGYAHYAKDDGEESFDVSYPERGAQYVGYQRRSVLAPTVVSGEKPCAVVYNL